MRHWWQNEEGEPMYSPEQIRAEERAQHEPEYCEICGVMHGSICPELE